MDIVTVLKDGLLASGAGWILWLLVGLSVVVVAVAVERGTYFRRRAADTRALAEVLEQHLKGPDPSGAPTWPRGGEALAARVVNAGLAMAGEGEAAMNQAMMARSAMERELLEHRLTLLGTVGSNAPFVGLLGTVVGIVHAFEHLGRTQGPQQSQAVMAGIAEALVATAVGLMVAIPAIVAYNAFQRRASSLLASSEVLSRILLAHAGRLTRGPLPRSAP